MNRRSLCLMLSAVLFCSALPVQAAAAPVSQTSSAESAFTTTAVSSGVCITGYQGSGTAVSIPATVNGQTVSAIDTSSFASQTLTTLTLPASVVFLGIPDSDAGIFLNCPALTSIQVASDNPVYCSVDGVLFNKSKSTLLQYPCGRTQASYAVPNGVNTIDAMAFYGADKLEEVTFPETLSTLCDSAFAGCSSLKKAALPLQTTTLQAAAFQSCTSLTEIRILNPICEIAMFSGTLPASAVIYGYEGSTAYAYAQKFHRSFQSLGTFQANTCTHPNVTSAITTPATCTQPGVITQTCKTCGKEVGKSSVSRDLNNHDAVAIAAKAATCTASGQTGGTVCSRCGKQLTAPTVLAKLGHTSPKTTTTKATVSKGGSIKQTCTRCNAVLSTTAIPYPKTIALSKTLFTYSGKTKNVKVTVTGSDGKAIAASNYTLTIPSRKNVGKYTVKIAFSGSKYSGSTTKTFTIKPAATSISKLTASRKGFTVKWKKKTAQTTGYQIQYCTKKSFPSSLRKTKTVAKNTTVSQSIAKLTARKKYYVRVRTYKTVKSGGTSTPYYSSWSKVRSIKTK
ncbi:MAG: leucine-rich repeat protein [Eubacteriales bacterium]|nr:leucine-rich repeat protein [Eubacteriales bacterium]